mmetsp:Transcript_29122/g.45568  ORF Transcript_29122/g.45568 Transcript_29122/m.45568 type:complete len:379 (+) Transcript_29122:126-1262(+)|eukprot:CAMPEP_0169263556 /NCGR_PEP_ID=MMETSP1016-20121227/44492_1 /TAXON_ID=342587 /ORGANISM="Karlodinium micrum, Strain CCMP2283" /LENGTH=378 /DNA_ID=CAMNT_0009346533 /DNA_START=35 /DNA_END=1171 /DNA_ORIENTATION=-
MKTGYALVALANAQLCCSLFVHNGARSATSSKEVKNPWVVTPDIVGTVETRPPRIFFLFLAVDKISNLAIWQNFFAGGSPSQYRALAHCKLPSCESQLYGTTIATVTSVPSYYCTDLVSPMNQLLHWALSDDPHTVNPADKFVFISDSTLPAKPFSEVYSTLSGRSGSDFCTFPSNEWADVPSGTGVDMAVKYHQWIVLERGHAEKASNLWSSGTMHDFMSRFRMNQFAYNTYSNNTYGDSRNFGCLDEFWHMSAIFGTLHVGANADTAVNFAGFSNSPLRVSSTVGWQGQCDTFVMWAKYLHAPGNNPFSRFYKTLDSPSIPHNGNDHRPGWWDTMSKEGIVAIRKSEFLFMRKFIDNPTLVGGSDFGTTYSNIVLR